MPIRFAQGDIRRLLAHFGMKRVSSSMYGGIGRDGKYRICKFDYLKDRDIVATGTAHKIARDLGFLNTREMKDYIDSIF